MNRSRSTIAIHGHRGCRGLLPENSLPAFEKAIDLGVDAIEMDIGVTKDNEIIVSHEPFMSRKYCFDPLGNEIPLKYDMMYNLYKMRHDEIKRFDCGSKFHEDFPEQKKIKTYKPLLIEVLELAKSKNRKIHFNIELKATPRYDTIYTPPPTEFVNLVLNTLDSYNVFDCANLQSFDLRILEEIKKQAPQIKVALLVDGNESISEKILQLSFKPDIISPYFKLLQSKVEVQAHKAHGFKVIPWTVNSIENMQDMIDLEVDGIITDYPNLLIQLFEQNLMFSPAH